MKTKITNNFWNKTITIKRITIVVVISICLISVVFIVATNYEIYPKYKNRRILPDSNMAMSIEAPVATDLVTVMIYDKTGKLINKQTTHNIITGAGAAYFCIQQDHCANQITGTVPAVNNVASPKWWIQFISGTQNTNEPTSSDCTSPSGGGAISGQVSGGKCIVNFGASPAQYQSGGSIITLSLTTGSGQLRTGAGTIDTLGTSVQVNTASVCSIINDGTPPASGTCQFSDTTPVFTNLSGGPITVNGLALFSGSNSNTAAGPLIIAEATLTPVTLAPGETIGVTWTIII